MNLGELKKILRDVKATNVRFGGFCGDCSLLPTQYQLGISENGKTICILNSPDVNGIEGDVYESIEDIWPDYPTKEDFLFNEDEY